MPDSLNSLGRRERQIMEIVFRRGRASAAEVLADLPDPPTYTSVRGMLRWLEEKGHLRHERDGLRYVYLPTADPAKARTSALRHLVTTFFDGSPAEAVTALLDLPDTKLSAKDRQRLSEMIRRAREEGR
jgi:BlaI family transcriptional regulator, penicillinase repressor